MTTTPDPRCSDRCQALTIECGHDGARVDATPTDEELLEVAREEAAIYGEGATVLDLETMLRVLRTVARRFPAGVVECGPLTDIHGVVAGEADADDAVVVEWVHPCKGYGGKLLHVPLGEQCDRCGESAEGGGDGR